MKRLIAVIFLTLCMQTVQALTIDVQGDCTIGHQLKISTDKPALIILRLNNGTPIYAYDNTTFTPQISGTLLIEAIADNERAVKVVEIQQPTTPTFGGGGGGLIGYYYLPSSTTTITLADGNNVTINWRTALGALIKASQEKGFDVKVKSWSYGLFVDCIGGICTKALGKTSGWMYQVNGKIPMVSSEQYTLNVGDTVVWYFSRSMSETPESSPYKVKIKIYSDWSFDVYINPSMPWSLPSKESSSESGSQFPKLTQTPKSTPKSKIINITKTNKSIKYVIGGNTTVEVNVTRIPLKISLKNAKDVSIEISKEKPAGLKFNNIYAYILDCFDIKLNKTVNVTISFAVLKDTLNRYNATPQDVFLAKYNRTWIYLPTNFTENETHYFFTVDVTNFSPFAIVIKWKNFPLKPSDPAIVKALNWLRQEQRADGGWGSLSNTSWVIMALVSAGENPYNWTKNGRNPIEYLKVSLNESTVAKMGTSDLARTILTLVALGENPRNFNGIDFVTKLKQKMKKNGQIGDYIYTTIWGIIALKACGENVSKSVEWLREHQNPDGGFAWAVGAESDFDDTAAAIQALMAGDVSREDSIVNKALDYLKTGQCEDGGMRYYGNSSSNSASDSWTIQALVSACVNPMEWKKNVSIVEHLLSLQSDEGYFKYTKYTVSNPVYITASAIMALLGKPQPIKTFTANETTVSTIATSLTTTVTLKTTTLTTTKSATTVMTPKIPGFEAVVLILILIALVCRRS